MESRPDLSDLAPETVQVSDLPRFPGMVGWFQPVLLGKLLLKVIVSDVFGQYADRRLIHAALDAASKDELLQRADLTGDIKLDADGAIWLDYVADLGDGFDATYGMAYLLAQRTLTVDGHTLPRAGVLVMGGDEVYPTATRDEYNIRLRKPYSFASPNVRGATRSPVLLLPGNHDWYDGLVNFLAIFCREKSTSLGSWRTRQRRSYFAAKLSDKWWVWGIDIALVRDMDQPQADYFVAIAEAMPQGSNIILCSAEPGWYKAESGGNSYRTLSYASWIAENARKDINIPLLLSGDSHHYARYSGAGRQYITSGGGGAFLHGTLELQDEIKADWLRQKDAVLSLKTTADEKHEACEVRACYPSQEESRKLLAGNWKFFWLNRGFSFLLGGLYALFAFCLTSLPRWDVALFVFLAFFGGLFAYTGYQERFDKRIALLSAAHAFAHVLAVMALSGVLYALGSMVLPVDQWHWLFWLAFVAALAVPIGGAIAGTIFGLNLMLTCRWFGINNNDAYSAMKIDSHRHFLRVRILGDTLQVYPIGVDRMPKRHEWKDNPDRAHDPAASVFAPAVPLNPRLIEGPVIIRAQHAPPTTDVKKPDELSPGSSAAIS